MFTDGIPEAQDSSGRTFGQNGIVSAVIRAGFDSPEKLADAILESVRLHSGKPQPDDDQALLVIQVGTVSAANSFGAPAFSFNESGEELTFELVNTDDAGQLSTTALKQKEDDWLVKKSCLEEQRLDIWNAVWEAIQNALKHGSQPGDVLRIDLSGKGNRVDIMFTQPRQWPDWDLELGTRRGTPDISDERGFGTHIMLKFASSITVRDQGRKILMRFVL